jgi:hypothetical protein
MQHGNDLRLGVFLGVGHAEWVFDVGRTGFVNLPGVGLAGQGWWPSLLLFFIEKELIGRCWTYHRAFQQ